MSDKHLRNFRNRPVWCNQIRILYSEFEKRIYNNFEINLEKISLSGKIFLSLSYFGLQLG